MHMLFLNNMFCKGDLDQNGELFEVIIFRGLRIFEGLYIRKEGTCGDDV